MLKLAQVPDHAGAPHRAASKESRNPRQSHLYYAFLSYSHQDEAMADWLHDELESFKVPHNLSGRLTENGVIPNRLMPIFRDRHELAAAGDLATEIQAALASSRFLIVMCSPAAAKSHWTNAEIETFKRHHPDGCVLAAIVDGEPFASERLGCEDEECFPPALRHKYDRRGRPTSKRAEPLAADLRESGDGRRVGLLKLVAGMLGVGLDDLVQREQTRRQRKLAWIAAASLAGMAITSGLAITAVQSRDAARDQRREAEGLVAFMLGDLRDKLEPIGRLDALDGVGARVLAYYHRQDTSDLSDAALVQRSKALSLMGEVANLRGNVPAAQRFYREAMAGTAEAIRRNPNDPERLFDHAQNVFYVGEIAMQRGDNAAGETAMREYKQLASRMIALQPDNMRWRMEAQYADANLGVVLYRQRKFAEAIAPLQQALQRIEALAAADPDNAEYQRNLPEAFAWLADGKTAEGMLSEAATLREQHVALLKRLLSGGTDDIYYRLRLVKADQLLGELYAMIGRADDANAALRSAASEADRLVAIEPENTRSLEFSFKAKLALAGTLLGSGDRAGAEAQAGAGCAIVSHLLALDPATPAWRAGLRDCWLIRARIAAAAGQQKAALVGGERAVRAARSVKTADPGGDRIGVAAGYRIMGDASAALGDPIAAKKYWNGALEAFPRNFAEKPNEMAERTVLLARLGQSAEARQLAARLSAMGYRSPDLRIN